jgi:hypothetical protein
MFLDAAGAHDVAVGFQERRHLFAEIRLVAEQHGALPEHLQPLAEGLQLLGRLAELE